MHIRLLSFFIEIAHYKSIREISRALDVSPTSVIRKIDQIEHYFNSKLFDRDNGLYLTESGKLLQQSIPSLVTDLNKIHTLLNDLHTPDHGKVLLYAGGSVVADLLSPALCAAQKKYPKLRFEIAITSTPLIAKAVIDGVADIGITIFAPETNAQLVHVSHSVRHVAFVSPQHPLADRTHITLNDIMQESLAIPDQEFAVRRRLDMVAKYNDIILEPSFTTSSLEMQRDLAIRGIAALILPEFCFSYECNAGLLKKIYFSDGDCLNTNLELTVHRGRSLTFAARVVLREIEKNITAQLSVSKPETP